LLHNRNIISSESNNYDSQFSSFTKNIESSVSSKYNSNYNDLLNTYNDNNHLDILDRSDNLNYNISNSNSPDLLNTFSIFFKKLFIIQKDVYDLHLPSLFSEESYLIIRPH